MDQLLIQFNFIMTHNLQKSQIFYMMEKTKEEEEEKDKKTEEEKEISIHLKNLK